MNDDHQHILSMLNYNRKYNHITISDMKLKRLWAKIARLSHIYIYEESIGQHHFFTALERLYNNPRIGVAWYLAYSAIQDYFPKSSPVQIDPVLKDRLTLELLHATIACDKRLLEPKARFFQRTDAAKSYKSMEIAPENLLPSLKADLSLDIADSATMLQKFRDRLRALELLQNALSRLDPSGTITEALRPLWMRLVVDQFPIVFPASKQDFNGAKSAMFHNISVLQNVVKYVCFAVFAAKEKAEDFFTHIIAPALTMPTYSKYITALAHIYLETRTLGITMKIGDVALLGRVSRRALQSCVFLIVKNPKP